MYDVSYRCGYKELAERLEEEDALSRFFLLHIDENGIFNVDVNVDEIEIETEESFWRKNVKDKSVKYSRRGIKQWKYVW